MNQEIIQQEDLMSIAEVKSKRALEEWLRENNIRHFKGKSGRITTTRFYINHPDDGSELDFA